MKISRPFLLFLACLFLTASSFFIPLIHRSETLSMDWNYFNSLNFLIQSIVWAYHQFPLHDPWVCGGVDILSNPQTRLFSPLAVLDLIFEPHIANLLTFVLYGFLGLLGFLGVGKKLGWSAWVSLLVGFLFTNCSWFSLHFLEGHIRFADLQLLPCVLYLTLLLPSVKAFLGLLGLSVFFFLDGAIYAFLFSILTFICSFLVRLGGVSLQTFRSFWKQIRENRVQGWICTLSIFSAAAIILARMWPTLLVLRNQSGNSEFLQMNPKVFFLSLFWPFQRHAQIIPESFGFHEYACYFSWIGLAIILWCYFFHRLFWKMHRKLLLLVLFWVWIGTGFLGQYNPWTIYRSLPILNFLHVQSRLLLLGFLFFLIFLGFTLQYFLNISKITQNRKTKIACLLLFSVLAIESFGLRVYTLSDSYTRMATPPLKGLITRVFPAKTIHYVKKPNIYLEEGFLSQICYEPSMKRVNVLTTGNVDYHGEVFSDSLRSEYRWIKPGEVQIQFEASDFSSRWVENSNVEITLNAHSLFGWKIQQGSAKIIENGKAPDSLIKLKVFKSRDKVSLNYSPSYLPFVSILYAIGLMLGSLALGLFLFFYPSD